MVCPACGRSFAGAQALSAHRGGRRGRASGAVNPNPCAYSQEERDQIAAARRQRATVAMRQKRGGLSLEEYRAAVRPDPEDVKRRRNEASARWRARHPDQWAEIKRRSNQRQRRRERRRQRRRAYGRKWRSLHPTYFLERRRAAGARPRVRLGGVGSELGPPWQKNDELIVQAWRLVSHVPRGEVVSFLEDELAYDAVGEAVLAMLEGSDPVAAVHRFYAGERAWARLTCRLRLDGKWECD